jgi:hypothetical protein
MSKLKPCSIRGVDYPSRSAAAAALGLTRQRIQQLATLPSDGRTAGARSKPVTIDGVTYPGVVHAAGALGVSYWVARYLAKLGTVSRRSRRAPASSKTRAIAKPDRPPLRNAIKVIRRVVVTLESSVWIRRLRPVAARHRGGAHGLAAASGLARGARVPRVAGRDRYGRA